MNKETPKGEKKMLRKKQNSVDKTINIEVRFEILIFSF